MKTLRITILLAILGATVYFGGSLWVDFVKQHPNVIIIPSSAGSFIFIQN